MCYSSRYFWQSGLNFKGIILTFTIAMRQQDLEDDSWEPPESIEQPIGPELDLHTFRASEVHSLLADYLGECSARGILTVRVIHGKGTGALREQVHRRLEQLPELVANWAWPASTDSGGWGATWVYLKP